MGGAAFGGNFQKWYPVCRHNALFAAYTVTSSDEPLMVRLAVGVVYDKQWKNPIWHTRAQAYYKGEWEWLCIDNDDKSGRYVYMCESPEVNFVVKHHITPLEALLGQWRTYPLTKENNEKTDIRKSN